MRFSPFHVSTSIGALLVQVLFRQLCVTMSWVKAFCHIKSEVRLPVPAVLTAFLSLSSEMFPELWVQELWCRCIH